jgi:UDP-N-acetylmuramoyl-tripeptide--D-alanyl-D-alanine ligase
MGEVGAQGPAFHREVLEAAFGRGIERVWLLGEACHFAQRETGLGQSLTDTDEAVAAVLQWLNTSRSGPQPLPATVWFKASRFMQLERTFKAVREAATQSKANHAAFSH